MHQLTASALRASIKSNAHLWLESPPSLSPNLSPLGHDPAHWLTDAILENLSAQDKPGALAPVTNIGMNQIAALGARLSDRLVIGRLCHLLLVALLLMEGFELLGSILPCRLRGSLRAFFLFVFIFIVFGVALLILFCSGSE